MKAERQQRERTSRVIQPSRGGGWRIVDNRPIAIIQREQQMMANIFSDQNQYPIQRCIFIEEKEYTVDEVFKEIFKEKYITDVKEADTIEEILNEYFKENRKFSSVTEMLDKARQELKEELPQQDSTDSRIKTLRNTYGKQLDVQAKMVEITRLVKRNILDSETIKYSSDVLINGLCGGWTKLFMKYPDWVEPIYNAVRSWRKPARISDAEALLHFENHLDKTTKFKGSENVVKLLRDVYDAMDYLEPDAGYGNPPDWTDFEVKDRPTSSTSDETITTEEIILNLRNKNAANLVCRELQKRTIMEVSGECMAGIESDLHHMALRIQKMPKKGSNTKLRLLITVVETEKKGIIKTNNWGEAESVLNSWLEKEEANLKRITLRIKMTGFGGVK